MNIRASRLTFANMHLNKAVSTASGLVGHNKEPPSLNTEGFLLIQGECSYRHSRRARFSNTFSPARASFCLRRRTVVHSDHQ